MRVLDESDDTPTIDKPPPRQVISSGHKPLRCKLTDEEHRAKGQGREGLLDQQKRLKVEHKAKVSEMKLQATALQEQVDECERDVRLQSEIRSVEVEEIADFARGVVEVVRIDTGETVSSRLMTEHDRQQRLAP